MKFTDDIALHIRKNREIHYWEILECTLSYVKFMTIVVCYF